MFHVNQGRGRQETYNKKLLTNNLKQFVFSIMFFVLGYKGNVKTTG